MTVEAAARTAPGVMAAALVEGIGASASVSVLLGGLEALRRLEAWAAAEQARLLAQLQVHQDAVGDPDDREWLSEEVGAVLRVCGGTARSRMLLSAEMVRRLPETHGLLAAGAISAVQARELTEAIADLSDEAATGVETRVLGRAPQQTAGQFRVSLRRAVMAAAPPWPRRDM